jgi:hypothetical protein
MKHSWLLCLGTEVYLVSRSGKALKKHKIVNILSSLAWVAERLMTKLVVWTEFQKLYP